MNLNPGIKILVERLVLIPEVDAVMLAGSIANKTNDALSDYDLYVYQTKEIDLEIRKIILSDLVSSAEYDNRFWETEDDVVLKEGSVPADIIYRAYDWIEENIKNRMEKHLADTGYTTCFVANIKNSIILFDRSGRLSRLKTVCETHYPIELKNNIIRKNYPLLKRQIPAYYWQIEKALKREDAISVNHRTAAFLASYFDIVFAANDMLHPGEKKIVKALTSSGAEIPVNMEDDLNKLFASLPLMNSSILAALDKLILQLDSLLVKKNLYTLVTA